MMIGLLLALPLVASADIVITKSTKPSDMVSDMCSLFESNGGFCSEIDTSCSNAEYVHDLEKQGYQLGTCHSQGYIVKGDNPTAYIVRSSTRQSPNATFTQYGKFGGSCSFFEISGDDCTETDMPEGVCTPYWVELLVKQGSQLGTCPSQGYTVQGKSWSTRCSPHATFTKYSKPSDVAEWSKHMGKNCYGGHGATNIDTDPVGKLTLAECEKRCDESADCTGITIQWSLNGEPTDCWRRSNINIAACDSGNGYDTWTKTSTAVFPSQIPASPNIVSWQKDGEQEILVV